MKDIFSVFTKKKWMLRMVIVGVLFYAVAIPFKRLFTLVPGMTEVRPANMIPVVFGILWGPAGAWGIAIANLISDISDVLMSGGTAADLLLPFRLKIFIFGFIINFFYAYLPYKLWYSLDFGRGYVVKPRLRSVADILKFIYIVFVDSLITTILLSVLFEHLGFQQFGSSGLLLFFNNFDFAVVLGVPTTLLITSNRNAQFWTPAPPVSEEESRKKKKGASEILLDLLLAVICIIGVGLFLAEKIADRGVTNPTSLSAFCASLLHFDEENAFYAMPSNTAFGIVIFFALIELFYIFRPFKENRSEKFRVNIRIMSIRAKVVLGFLLITVFSVLMVGITSYRAESALAQDAKTLWEHVYTVVGIALNVMFLVTIVFLRFVERTITIPLEGLAEQADAFAARDHYADAQSGDSLDVSETVVRTGDEIEGLSESFGRMMEDITSYVRNLTVITAEKERIGAELNVATQIQADMLPRIFPPFPERNEFDLYASMEPAKEVGGDFYDFFLIDEDHLGLVMADVSGKGVPAALFMVIAKTLIKNRAQLGGTPSEVLTYANDQLCEGNEAELFVTVWFAILTISTGKGLASNAGHEHPAIRRKDGQFELIKTKHSPAVATMEGIRFREEEFELHPGDTLYVYTDGVAEATDANNKLYGTDRMLEALNKDPDATPEVILKNVRSSMDEFVGDAPQFDDITMLACKYNGAKV